MLREVEYQGGPLDGERESLELVRSPEGDRWALPGELATAVVGRPDWEHVYRLDPSTAIFTYMGYRRGPAE